MICHLKNCIFCKYMCQLLIKESIYLYVGKPFGGIAYLGMESHIMDKQRRETGIKIFRH